MSPTVLPVPNFAVDAARWILSQASAAIAQNGLFRIALAGGETPAAVYSEMARQGTQLDWSRVQITFGDERCVPPEDPQSNFLMAQRSLLQYVPIPEGNVFRIRGEITPSRAAAEYEQKLETVASRLGESRYRHDLVLLGLGPDGHTASLFPGSPTLDEVQHSVVPTIGPKPPPQRITMTFPLLNAARQVAFLVNDPRKQVVIDEILGGRGGHPAGMVRPTAGSVIWLLGHAR
jgi:6-phosphogluconolactonase